MIRISSSQSWISQNLLDGRLDFSSVYFCSASATFGWQWCQFAWNLAAGAWLPPLASGRDALKQKWMHQLYFYLTWQSWQLFELFDVFVWQVLLIEDWNILCFQFLKYETLLFSHNCKLDNFYFLLSDIKTSLSCDYLAGFWFLFPILFRIFDYS